jgi:hypothetical protein
MKERPLGAYADGPYCTDALAVNKESTALAKGWDTLGYLMEQRRIGYERRTYTRSVPEYIGVEQFFSSRRKRPLFNDCTHRKTYAVNYAYTAAFKIRDTFLVYSENNLRRYYREPFPSVDDVGLLDQHFNTAGVRNAQSTAWGTMQPRFEGNVNMFVFLAELKDFKSLLRIMANKPLLKLSNFVRRLRTKNRKLRLDPSLPLAQAHLTNEFAIKPLISDIIKITCQLETLAREAQQKFADAGRERSSRHYTEELFREDTDTRTAYQQSAYPHLLVGTSKTLTFNATMEYSYRYNMRGPLEAFMRYWGLVPNAEAVWELIPFSFLLDYFIKIGDSIRTASRDGHVGLNLNQYCESLTSYSTSGHHYKSDHLYAPLITGEGLGDLAYDRAPNGLVSGYVSSLYTRRVTTPNRSLALPRLAVPSSKQGLNMLALARCFI